MCPEQTPEDRPWFDPVQVQDANLLKPFVRVRWRGWRDVITDINT
jgi:hypothetical protein